MFNKTLSLLCFIANVSSSFTTCRNVITDGNSKGRKHNALVKKESL